MLRVVDHALAANYFGVGIVLAPFIEIFSGMVTKYRSQTAAGHYLRTVLLCPQFYFPD